jgi:hypothetical protein
MEMCFSYLCSSGISSHLSISAERRIVAAVLRACLDFRCVAERNSCRCIVVPSAPSCASPTRRDVLSEHQHCEIRSWQYEGTLQSRLVPSMKRYVEDCHFHRPRKLRRAVMSAAIVIIICNTISSYPPYIVHRHREMPWK